MTIEADVSVTENARIVPPCSSCRRAEAAQGRKMCGACLEKARRKMIVRRDAGQCYECRAPVERGHTRCRPCLDVRATIRSALVRERSLAGLCIACGVPPAPAMAAMKCLKHYFAAVAALANHRVQDGPRLEGTVVGEIWERQKGRCMYTRLPLILGGGLTGVLTASLDHKVSLDSGGDNSAENLQWVSSFVNFLKGRLTDEEFRNVLGRAGLRRLTAVVRARAMATALSEPVRSP